MNCSVCLPAGFDLKPLLTPGPAPTPYPTVSSTMRPVWSTSRRSPHNPVPKTYQDILAMEVAFPLTMVCGRAAISVQAKPSMKVTDLWEQCRDYFGNYLELELCIAGGRLLDCHKSVSWNGLTHGNAILIYREDGNMLAVVEAVRGRVVKLCTFEGVQVVTLTQEPDMEVIGTIMRVTRGRPLENIGMMNVAQMQSFLRHGRRHHPSPH